MPRCLRRATQTATASHPLLEPVAKHLETMAAFDRHEAIFFEVGRRSRVLLSAFIWRTDRGQVRCGAREPGPTSRDPPR